MRTAFCEKDCQSCSQFLSDACPGCSAGPGKTLSTDCPIATCARLKGIKFCSDCSSCKTCRHYTARHEMPLLRKKEAEAAERKKQFSTRHLSSLANYYWALLLLATLPGIVSAVLSIFNLSTLSTCISLGSCLLTGLVLLKMGQADLFYKTAGLLSFLRGAVSVLLLCTSDMYILRALLSGGFTVAGIFYTYYLMKGHIDTFASADRQLSGNWDSLWQAYKLVLIASFVCSMMLALTDSLIVTLLSLVAVIAGVVISIVDIVFLFRSAKVAESYKKELHSTTSP